MFVPTILLASSLVAVSRGGPGVDGFRSWAVHDTFLDSQAPTENFGRDPLLSSGPGKFVLLSFPNLDFQVPEGMRVRSARLVLTQDLGATAEITSVSEVIGSWGEGPGRRGPRLYPTGSPIATTWRTREGGSNWQGAGASGVADRVPLAASATVSGQEVVISGLEGLVNQMVTEPWRKRSIGFTTRAVADFASSESIDPAARPRLEMELEPVARIDLAQPDLAIEGIRREGQAWIVLVRNLGAARSGPFRVDGGTERTVEQPALEPGQATSVRLDLGPPPSLGDMRLESIEFSVNSASPEITRRNNGVTTWWRALPIRLSFDPAEASLQGAEAVLEQSIEAEVRRMVEFLNRTALPQSRFSFAPDGVRARVRWEGFAEGAPKLVLGGNPKLWRRDLATQLLEAAGARWIGHDRGCGHVPEPDFQDPFAGIMGGGDTRDDSDLPSILGVVREPWFDPILSTIPAPATDLLAATDAALLEAKTMNPMVRLEELVPKTVLLRVLDALGQPVQGAKLSWEGGEAALTQGPAKVDGAFNAFFEGKEQTRITVTGPTGSAVAVVKPWQLIEAGARGNLDAAILTLRTSLPPVPIKREVNHGLNRLVSFSAPSVSPVQLARTVDGDFATGLPWPVGTTGDLDIDLGKDRSLGEVEITLGSANVWERFRVFALQTGQVAEPSAWAFEPFGAASLPYRAEFRDGLVTLRLYGLPARARTLRIKIDAARTPVEIREVRVFSAAEAP